VVDREAAKEAFAGFLTDTSFNSNQIEFVNLVIDHLTQSGWLAPSRLYETPFIDFSARGVDGMFSSEQVSKMITILNDIKDYAVA